MEPDFKDIHYMCGLNPIDPQYSRYLDKPGILAAGYKLVDCYTAICQARTHMQFYNCNDYGELVQSDDEVSVLWARFQFIIDAIMYYNITIDLSWQVVWAYFTPTSLEFLLKNNYEKISKECTLEKLNILLKKEINNQAAREIKKIVNKFFEDKFIIKIREIYNYNKHRGGFHVPGLGENYKHLAITLGNNTKIPILSRRELDIEQVYKDLLIMDNKIVNYIETLYNKILPGDYTSSNVDFNLLAVNYKELINLAKMQG